MSNNFKLSAIVVALATVSGSAIAAPTPVTNLKNDTTYGWYQRLLGQTETVNSSNFDPIAQRQSNSLIPIASTWLNLQLRANLLMEQKYRA